MLTAAQVRKLFDTNPGAGALTWRISPSNNVHVGDVAGSVRKTDRRRVVSIDGRLYDASRVIWLWMTGAWPKRAVDHCDCDPSNDAWANLRLATRSQDAANIGLRSSNRSGVKGDFWAADHQKWRAYVTVNGREIRLGYCDTREKAALAGQY